MSQKNSLSRADIIKVLGARGKREHGKLFSLVSGAHGSPTNLLKIACVVSGKTARRAVDRNLIKRRCRAAAKTILARDHKANAYIFYARPSALSATYDDIKKDILNLINKTKLSESH
ncbi:MAG TPA: ribonuclease P protein component [Candidatus Paceibacterota bacterium]